MSRNEGGVLLTYSMKQRRHIFINKPSSTSSWDGSVKFLQFDSILWKSTFNSQEFLITWLHSTWVPFSPGFPSAFTICSPINDLFVSICYINFPGCRGCQGPLCPTPEIKMIEMSVKGIWWKVTLWKLNTFIFIDSNRKIVISMALWLTFLTATP